MFKIVKLIVEIVNFYRSRIYYFEMITVKLSLKTFVRKLLERSQQEVHKKSHQTFAEKVAEHRSKSDLWPPMVVARLDNNGGGIVRNKKGYRW